MTADPYNLVLKLYMDWDNQGRVRFYGKGRIQGALLFFNAMTLKGMVPEPRTKISVYDMNIKLKESRQKRGNNVKE
uniref:Uncharacterized protein n=1 Tax=Quercus lobata TaxID=97700 RepID=A0A7N2R8I1_QUELO